MTAVPTAGLMTAEEYLAAPTWAYGRGASLVEGEVVVGESRIQHQRIGTRILFELGKWIEAAPGRGCAVGSIDALVDDLNVYAADVSWYSEDRRPPRDAPPPYPMPDLAVEVRSPSTWRYDIGAKKSGYERAGLRELWLVDVAASEVIVFRRSAPDTPAFDVALELAGEDVLASPLLPDFALRLSELFA
ncbi:MAG: Uma2 family endonuclease [Actinomycetota bacterium]|nr:Uma2 family endonuclease [Actinomycetota bacterium]